MCSICVDSFMFENGERYCHVVNKDTGEPLYYPNLYITTQVRNRSESISTMKVIAGSISLLYRFFMRKEINIDERMIILGVQLSKNQLSTFGLQP